MKLKAEQPILSLKPTQFSVGILEVEYKAGRLEKMSAKKRKKLIHQKPIPVVISPAGELFVTDHHHFLFACYQAGIRKLPIEVIADWSKAKLSYSKFWQKMVKKDFCYLYDQFGEGPRSPLYLPPDVRGMADDPYRSLAWVVKKEGGFINSDENFSEFQWANFLRDKKLLDGHGRAGLQRALTKAIALVKAKSPKHLPGAIAEHQVKSNQDREDKETVYIEKAKKRGPWATAPLLEGDE